MESSQSLKPLSPHEQALWDQMGSFHAGCAVSPLPGKKMEAQSRQEDLPKSVTGPGWNSGLPALEPNTLQVTELPPQHLSVFPKVLLPGLAVRCTPAGQRKNSPVWKAIKMCFFLLNKLVYIW